MTTTGNWHPKPFYRAFLFLNDLSFELSVPFSRGDNCWDKYNALDCMNAQPCYKIGQSLGEDYCLAAKFFAQIVTFLQWDRVIYWDSHDMSETKCISQLDKKSANYQCHFEWQAAASHRPPSENDESLLTCYPTSKFCDAFEEIYKCMQVFALIHFTSNENSHYLQIHQNGNFWHGML